MVYLVLKPNTLVVKGINTSELHIIHSSPPKSCSSYNFWVLEVYIRQQSLPIYHAWHSVILSQYFRHTLVIQRYTCIQSSLFCPLAFFSFRFCSLYQHFTILYNHLTTIEMWWCNPTTGITHMNNSNCRQLYFSVFRIDAIIPGVENLIFITIHSLSLYLCWT